MGELQNNEVVLPLLDLSKPNELSLLSSLYEACQEWGFFYVANHGIPKELFTSLCSLTKDIFNLPSNTKLKLGPSSSLKTYTPHFIASPYFECLRVSGPDFFASAQSSADQLSLPHKSEFCEILQEYGKKMVELSRRITEVVLKTLGDGFDNKFYNSEFSNCHGYFRIINYTLPNNLGIKEDHQVEGLGMHTDMSCITIVHQDEVGGLQMKSKTGTWIDINPCQDCLVVNIGDLLQAWSNGRLRSSEHRVVLRRSVNRLSLAFFWCFEDEKVIAAPDEVVGEGNCSVYQSFVCVDYLKFREINNEVGKFHKIGYTVKDFAGLKCPVVQ